MVYLVVVTEVENKPFQVSKKTFWLAFVFDCNELNEKVSLKMVQDEIESLFGWKVSKGRASGLMKELGVQFP